MNIRLCDESNEIRAICDNSCRVRDAPQQRDEMASHEESSLLAPENETTTSSEVSVAVKPRSWCRRYCILIVILTAILPSAAAVILILPDHALESDGPQIRGARAIALACNATRFPQTCTSSLAANPLALTASPHGLTVVAVTAATAAVSTALSQAVALDVDPEIVVNTTYIGLVDDCKSTLALALEQLQLSSATLTSLPNLAAAEFATLQTSLSAALTFTGYCGDGLARVATLKGVDLRQRTNLTYQIVSNGLAFVNTLAVHGEDLESWVPTYFLANARRDATVTSPPSPAPSRRRRMLLESPPNWIQDRVALLEESMLDPNVTVAQDGSGDFSRVQDAVDAAPENYSIGRFVIHIKAGVYDEVVRVAANRINVMFLGDGINRTIITGNLSVHVPGITTFKSATVGVEGEGFMAKGVTFQNTAGAISEQAVALRVSADKCALYQCSVEGFQDTLWAQAFRQFYKECTITGTVDFVFGNAAAVLQDCNLLARSNLPGKHNVYTAQGRSDPGQCTGFSIHNCTLDGTPDLKELNASQTQHVTYLGRPWKQFSLSVISESYISSLVDPTGWLPWSGDFALETLFYGEYSNTGPGANTQVRVNWSTTITDPALFSRLRPTEFLAATSWLPSAGIPFTNSL